MSEQWSAKPPSYKESSKFFPREKALAANSPFKVFPEGRLLTPNGVRLVSDFEESAGRFLGGGVMKSKDLEKQAERSERAREIKAMILAQTRFMSKKDVVKMSTQMTSEWIALEYALLLSVTLYGQITPIRWDKLLSVSAKKKGFAGFDLVATLKFLDGKETVQSVDIQANKQNIESLLAIAKACGVSVA